MDSQPPLPCGPCPRYNKCINPDKVQDQPPHKQSIPQHWNLTVIRTFAKIIRQNAMNQQIDEIQGETVLNAEVRAHYRSITIQPACFVER